MKRLVSMLLVFIGLLNLYPIIGAVSAEQLHSLYGITINTPDLEILMRHRAVLLGLVGGFLLISAFRSSFQAIAAAIGLASMSSFVVLAYLSSETGAEINKVVMADILGSIVAIVALVVMFEERRRTTKHPNINKTGPSS